MTLLEVCIEDTIGLEACLSTGVTRVELCAALSVGGLTPSAGFITLATKSPVAVHVLIRPRAGDFYYTKNEVDLMCNDIAFAVDTGVKGIVIGAANKNGTLNLEVLRRLSRAAGPAHITLHRVIDTLENPLEAMEQVIDLGFSTILSSGGKPRALDGVHVLAELYDRANGRIHVMAGAGLTPSELARINQQTGITYFHSSCSQVQPITAESAKLGFNVADARSTSAVLIRQYQTALAAINRS